MLIEYLLSVLISFTLGISLLFLLRKFTLRYNAFILKGIPIIGGMSIGLSFLIACLVVSFSRRNLPPQALGIVISSFIMLILGVIDDLRELSIAAKFFVQIIATSLLVLFGIRTHIVYIGNISNIIITFLWVIGITNAFNLLDIMDGLAAGIALIVTISFSVISFLNGDNNTLLMTLVLAGALLSFLRYNLPPAKIYMGNSGSHFLGFLLAAIAITISYASLETKIALLSPLLILGFPIFDTFFLILIRMHKNRLPFRKSNDHLALRLLSLGCSKKKALLIMLALGLFFSGCGVITSQVSNRLDIIVIALVVLVSLVIAKKMSKVAIYD